MKQQKGIESVVKVYWVAEHCAYSIFFFFYSILSAMLNILGYQAK